MSTRHGSITQAHGVEIRVQPVYLPDESNPKKDRFVFGYHIILTNKRPGAIQLLRRHWVILDADGERRDVRGAGVVGRQPILRPGATFEYRSGCPLGTSWGTMEGTYTFREVAPSELDQLPETLEEDESLDETPAESGRSEKGRFEVAVGRFYLVASHEEVRA